MRTIKTLKHGVLIFILAFVSVPFKTAARQFEKNGIIVGIEYVTPRYGAVLSGLKIPAVKPLPDQFAWCAMQKTPTDPINFSITDNLVKEYQNAGFTTLIFGLKSTTALSCPDFWGVSDAKTNHAVPEKYESHYQRWIKSFVERYDMDGIDDMPELKYPVVHYEIGVEFSSYEPGATADYLKKLELAYKAAHDAFPDVIIGHAALLLTAVFNDNPGPSEYEDAFKNIVGTNGKGLNDMRMILDRPDIFDAINIHSLGWPYEIEQVLLWLNYETEKRNYSKPIIISDTTPTSFAGYGSAARCIGVDLAELLPPATEKDRCRLADYFNKLIGKDKKYINWLRNYLAADTVHRVVVAAEQGVDLIDTAFTFDLPFANTALFQAGAGNSGWGGMLDANVFSKTSVKRPAYYALQHLQKNILGYSSIRRVKTADDLRLYKIRKSGKTFYIAWYGYKKLYLPGDPMPKKKFSINVRKKSVRVEKMKSSDVVSSKKMTATDGILKMELTPAPVYFF